jgi:predicted GH43/DUF377 family glycosyl hydrolase
MPQTVTLPQFTRATHNPILRAGDWPYPVNSVFNAGAVLVDRETLLLVRVEDKRGISHLTVARSSDGATNWRIDPEPTFCPHPAEHPEENWGVEDPRITWVPSLGEWYITYTAFSSVGPLVALARTRDFGSFERFGPILAPENKDAALFPRTFNDRWLLLHRPVAAGWGSAHIWLSASPDLKHWGGHRVVMEARGGPLWDSRKIGLNCPPLETREGWLILYHGVKRNPSGVIYRLGVALLDLEKPWIVRRRGDVPIFAPEAPYEILGDVERVVFPCGWTLVGDEIRLYYGAADLCVALATVSLAELLSYVLSCPEPQRTATGGYR